MAANFVEAKNLNRILKNNAQIRQIQNYDIDNANAVITGLGLTKFREELIENCGESNSL